ncbi:DUF4956 domain-containing protein [Treponema sp.]|uniref:DUF4956 domain-containing protein n=1 Tax=Treponema sp. TaxID=166 RepID=UPI00388D32E5
MDILSGFIVNEEVKAILFSMVMGLFAGIVIAAGYVLANKSKKYSKNFVITVLLLPVIMAIIIPFIATDLKKTLSLAGVFALVRFRSIPGDSKDILYTFFAAAAGLIMGLGSYFIGFVLVFVVSAIFILLSCLWKVSEKQVLKITIPEDMNYKDIFNGIFDKYLVKYSVKNVKTSNMGTLFTISYWVQPEKDCDTKAFIDELRTRNGNLNIILENPDDQLVPVL